MIKSFLVLLFLFPLCNYAQVESKPILYLNEELEQIDKITYANQVLKSIYREHTINKDSITIKKLRKLYEFDSLNSIELEQVQKVFNKYLNITDFDKNIILVFRDSLLGYSHYSNSVQQRKKLDEFDVISEKEYLKRRHNYDDMQKKCKKFAKKNNATPVYIYSENVDFTFKPKHHTKQKVPDIIPSIFFKNIKYGHVILKPNGKYFFYDRLTQDQVKIMIETDWTSYIKNFNRVKNNPKEYSLEFVDTMYEKQENELEKIAYKRFKQIQKDQKRTKNYKSNSTISIGFKLPNCYTHASY